ncbi:unnamed protein product [Durusdinium trenchii]|uniref:Uncharacterized protein n=2 Tax=Durusdinium trenchii TaxID=1381693 RepID=A0ABP0IMG5_9DINO
MVKDLGEADFAFLTSAEGEVARLANRMQVLACTIVYLLGDYYVQRLTLRASVINSRLVPYLGDELHEATLFFVVATSFAVAGSRGAFAPLLWLCSSIGLAVQWCLHLQHVRQHAEEAATSISLALIFAGLLAVWASCLACKCCGCWRSGKNPSAEVNEAVNGGGKPLAS